MIGAKNTFHALISQSTTSIGIYNYLDAQKVPMDCSDLLRWRWVLSVSALDKYIHDIVRIGMIEIFEGRRNPTPKYNAFQIDMNIYNALTITAIPVIEFEKEIIRKHSFLAFQLPEKIADALSYIWDANDKWGIVSSHMRVPISANDLKTKLKNIVLRRNQIVHEGDCFSTGIPLQQQPISLADTEDVVTFITDLVDAIGQCVV